MKQIEVNPSNKPYYSEDFINGFECGTKTQFDADKEVIDRIEEAREELCQLQIERINIYEEGNKLGSFDCVHFDEVAEIIDKLIEEAEE